MAVTSVLYRSAVGRSAILYLNSDVVIEGKGSETVKTITKMKVFLKPNCLVQISYKSDFQKEIYRQFKI